jgi:CubicO group peptidase (beta-lactamase class C family)
MSRFLEDFTAFIRERGWNIYRVTEIVGDQAPETVTLTPCSACQNSYSIAKAFVVTAIGFLWDEGRIELDESVPTILGNLCPMDMDSRWKNVTVDMVLRHFCGLPQGFLDIDATDPRAFGTDYLGYLLREPMRRDPQVASVYTDGAYYLLSRLVEVRAGEPLDLFLQKRLFTPLGFREVAWSRCPKGHPMGATGLYIYTEDMAKLGVLYRDGGLWRGERLLSEAFIKIALSAPYELKPIADGVAFGKGGMHGQMLMVVPKQGRVVAWHGFVRGGVKELVRFVAEYAESD